MKVLIIGCGKMARIYFSHLKFLGIEAKMAFRSKSSINYQISLEKFGTNALISLRNASYFDIVFSCVDPNSHLPSILPFLSKASLILSEKPVCLNLEEASNLLDKEIFVLMNRRYYDWVESVKRLVKNKNISKIVVDIPEKKSNELWNGIPISIPLNSIHVFDLISYISGGLLGNSYLNYSDYGITCITKSDLIEEIIFNISYDAKERFSIKFYNKDATIIKCSPIENSLIYKKIEITEPSPVSNIREYTPLKENFVIRKNNLFKGQKPGIIELCQDLISNYKNSNNLIVPNIRESVELLNWMKNNLYNQ